MMLNSRSQIGTAVGFSTVVLYNMVSVIMIQAFAWQ